MRDAAACETLNGFPLIDFSIELIEGKYHDVDPSGLAFEAAGRGAMREGAQRSGTKLIEPIMKVEVMAPEESPGDVIVDLNTRRGQIQGSHSSDGAQVVEAMVPLATLFGYGNELRSFTQGHARYTMESSHYDEAPDGEGPPDAEPTSDWLQPKALHGGVNRLGMVRRSRWRAGVVFGASAPPQLRSAFTRCGPLRPFPARTIMVQCSAISFRPASCSPHSR